MNENIKYIAGAVAVVGLSVGAVLYFSRHSGTPPLSSEPVAAVTPSPVMPAEPEIKHPVPAADGNDALPSLDDSSPPMKDALADLIGTEPVERFIIPDDLVRHIVVSVDNLSDKKVVERLRPVKAVPGKFEVQGSEDAPVLDPKNYERYRPMVQLLGTVDTQRLITTYVRYYPLFQESYENLGHPPKYFNDRVVAVIDLLLETPEVKDPIRLAQPGVQYEFADPKLEALSAGQKILIRMGSENAQVVKGKLRALRTALLALPKTQPKEQP